MKIKKWLLIFTMLLSLVSNIPSSTFAAEAQPKKTQEKTSQTDNAQTDIVEEEEKLTFDIWEFQVTGNTVMEQTLVERAVYPYLGTNKTIDDVNAASNMLQILYKNNGYPTVLVDIPQQDVSKGIVKLNIIEGKIDRLKISGSRYFSLAKIRSYVPMLAVDEIPHLPTVQEQLQALNSANPDLSVTPIFRPGRSPGTVMVELRAKDDSPLHGSLELNGRNSSGTSRTRLIANLNYANLWLKNHDFSLTYQTSPEEPKEVQVLVGSYVMPINQSGDRLAIYAVRSDSETGIASAGALSVVGKGFISGARWVKLLQGEEEYFHSIVFGLDYKDFDEEVALEDAGSIVTPIDYITFSIDYNATVLAPSSITTFTISTKFAPRAFGNSSNEFENKRFQANPNFAILNASLNKEYRFDNGMKLLGNLSAQYSDQPLISNEQYSVGGAESVRGYFESQVLADDAIRASIEVQSKNLESLTKRGFKDAHMKAFLEGATTKIHQALPDIDDKQEIASIGFGLKVATKRSFNLSLDVATPLKDNDTSEKGDIRVHFLLRGAF